MTRRWPCAALAAPKVKHRAAITNPKAFGALLRAIDGFEGHPSTKACLQLQALLFPRPGELRLSEWNEFDFDKAVWNIPARRTKMRRDHACPLPRKLSRFWAHFIGSRAAARSCSPPSEREPSDQ
jgi:integrase